MSQVWICPFGYNKYCSDELEQCDCCQTFKEYIAKKESKDDVKKSECSKRVCRNERRLRGVW